MCLGGAKSAKGWRGCCASDRVVGSEHLLLKTENMARSRITTSAPELQLLSHKEAAFVIEYVRDMNPTRAATVVGLSPEYGHQLKKKPEIETAVQLILKRRLEDSDIDAEWLLYELVDNHLLARQVGNLSASNTALSTIGKLALVDAFAAEKVTIKTDEEVMARLIRGRERARAKRESRDASGSADAGVSFL